MKKRSLVIIILTVIAVLLIFLNCQKNAAVEKVKVGDLLTIQLDENPSTGFTWHYKIENEDIVEMASDKYIPKKDDNNLVGAGGVHKWEVVGLKEGKTKIIFKYYREWEPENVEDAIEYTIKVTK